MTSNWIWSTDEVKLNIDLLSNLGVILRIDLILNIDCKLEGGGGFKMGWNFWLCEIAWMRLYTKSDD